MPVTQVFQSNFTIGEISPDVYGRVDIDQYGAAVQSADNAVPIPQGGLTKRRGFAKLTELTVPTGEFVKLIPLEFSETERYICLLLMDGTYNFYNLKGVLVKKVEPKARTSTPDYDETGTRFLRGTDIKDAQHGPTLDPNEILVTHPLYAPVTIKRLGKNNFTVARTVFFQYAEVDKARTVRNAVVGKVGDFNSDGFVKGVKEHDGTVPTADIELYASGGDNIRGLTAGTLLESPNATLSVVQYNDLGTRIYAKLDKGSMAQAKTEFAYPNTFVVGSSAPPVNPAKGYKAIKAPKDTFSYSKYIKSPWDIQSVVWANVSNGDTFIFECDDSDIDISVTYKVTHVPLTPTTAQGATIGDDASELVTQFETALSRWSLSGGTVEAIYTEEPRIIYRKDGSIKVTDRTFEGINIILPNQDLNTPRRIWCSKKAKYDSNVLVRPVGGTLESIPQADQEKYIGEDVWSDNRGFPATTITHGGRAVFGGSYAKPMSLWFTQSGLSYHFSPDNLLEPLANDSISMTLNASTVGTISGMQSGRTLLVLTNNALISVNGEGNLITPLSVYSKLEAQHGSKYVKPVYMDNKVYYIHADTSVLNSTAFDYSKDTYLAVSESLLSSHLVRDVSEMAIVESLNEANATYMVLRNNSGELSTYSSVDSQGIMSWARMSTDGYVRTIAGLGEHLFIIVRRGEKYFLEAMTPHSPYADNGGIVESDEPIGYLGGLDYLAGKELALFMDGYPTYAVVQDNGIVELPFEANKIEYGLPIQFRVETLPPRISMPNKPVTTNEMKRVSKVKVHFYNTLGASIEYNNKRYDIADRNMGFVIDTPPELYSGVHSVDLLGWNRQGTIAVVSDKAVPTTVISIDKTVRLK